MGQIIDTYFKKLSEPVTASGISLKACGCLRRAGIYTVADVLLAGKPKLGTIRMLGTQTVDKIWETVAGYLEVSEGQMSDVFSRWEANGRLVLDGPITVLPLPASILRCLLSMGIYRIEGLVQARAGDYSKFLGMRSKEIEEIDHVLRFYLIRMALVRLLPWAEPAIHFLSDTPVAPPENKPDWRRQLSRINDRAWLVLELGTLQMLPLQKIAAQAGGISRERVRQIIKWTQEILQKNVTALTPLLDHLEERSGFSQQYLGSNPLRLGVLVRHLIANLGNPDLIRNEQELRQLIILVRSLVLYRSPWFWEEMEPRWRTFILLCCLAEPPLKKHKQVKHLLEEVKPEKEKNGYQDLAYTVLVNAGKPLHWSNIAEQACQLGRRDRFSSKAMLSSIQYYKKRFVRVGQGTYGLAEWGLRTPASYTHVIASILKEESRPMSQDQIFDRVLEFRPATWSSVNIVLNTHYRFYKSILNTYGLRGWLPATDRQDSTVSDWLIEKPTSFNRVERARAKGLHIDKIVSQDKLQQPDTPIS